jgi:DNA-binding MarR family transcriptional regulator
MPDASCALPFLLSRIGARTRALFEARELARLGISTAMGRVLGALMQHDDQRLGDLAALADIEMSTLSRLIGSMQARRLVKRRRSGKDARAVRIQITAEGRALAARLDAAAASFETAMTRGIAPREATALRRTLARIANAVDVLDQGEGSVDPRPRGTRRASAA